MQIRKVLFVTQFEELGFDALTSLLSLRRAALNHVVFLSVIARDKVALRRGIGYQKEEELRLREIVNIRFINWSEPLFEQGMEVGVYIPVGDLVPEAIRAAQREEVDLIVIGRSPKGPLEQFYAGSEIVEIIRRSQIPVLVFKPALESSVALEKPFERPLVATDGSPASLRSIDYLTPMTSIIKEVNLVRVVSELEIGGATVMEVQKTRKQERQQLDRYGAPLAAAGIPIRAQVYVGEPTEQIETAAREHGATMIVMGSSSKAKWVERWIGSVPRTVTEDSPFPTLLIPPPKS